MLRKSHLDFANWGLQAFVPVAKACVIGMTNPDSHSTLHASVRHVSFKCLEAPA